MVKTSQLENLVACCSYYEGTLLQLSLLKRDNYQRRTHFNTWY